MFLIISVAVLLHLSPSSAGDPCPSKFALAPCTCTYYPLQNRSLTLSAAGGTTHAPLSATEAATVTDPSSTVGPTGTDIAVTVVECRVSKTISALEETISNALDRRLVDRLVVGHVPPQKEHTLARLPKGGWLRRVRVRQFEVVNSKLSGDFLWHGNPFEGQSKSLLWLSAKKCSLTGALTHDVNGSVNTRGLNLLHGLQGLDLSDNFLTHVTGTAFRYPPANLSHVDLSRNSIQFVESAAFIYIARLRFLNLSHNLLQYLVGRSILQQDARFLEHIDLSWNLLEVLPVDFFIRMPVLTTVDLSNNFLYSMPVGPWGAVWKKLQFVDVTGNFIACDCNLMWLLPHVSVNNTTPAPSGLPGRTVRGSCSKSINTLFAVKYELLTLTRDRLNC